MKKIYTLIIFSLCLSGLWAQNEADFYTDYIDLALDKNLVTDYGADGTDDADDSEALQNAINELTQLEHGGRIYIPAGTYYFTKILMDNNIHIEIDKDAIIKPTQDEWIGVDPDNYKNYTIFYFTYKNKDFKNASIRCRQANERYVVDLREALNTRVRVFQLNSVDNFYLADASIRDVISRFSSITFGTEVHSGVPEGWFAPKNGVIKNMDTDDNHYGYGLVQSQALSNALFKNLWGDGGVTLRLETGYSQMNLQQIGGNFDIVARDIYNENGNAALMISPHETHNGTVNAANIESVNSGFAVRMSSGYTRYDEFGIGPGSFEDVIIENVKATYGATAQLKSKHFKYMPCELRGQISEDYNPDGESYSGPAIACVLNTASDEGEGLQTYPNEVTNTSSIDFEYQLTDIVTSDHVDTSCPGTYYISYNNDGGTHNNPISYNSTDDDLILQDAIKEGYTFNGWYDNPNFNDDKVSVIESGSAGDLNLWAWFTISTAVDDVKSNVVAIYPNPFTNRVVIELDNQHNYHTVQVLNIAGCIITQQQVDLSSKNITLQLAQYAEGTGIYFIKLIGDSNSYQSKLIKK